MRQRLLHAWREVFALRRQLEALQREADELRGKLYAQRAISLALLVLVFLT